jgi:nitroreductase
MVAARGCGLDTCPQAAFGNYHAISRRHLSIPENVTVVCGMELGRMEADEPANALVPPREPVEAFATFLSD